MTEGWVPQIVSESNRFRQVLVELHGFADGPGNLCHLHGMREPGAVVVAFVVHENLGFVFEPTKSGGMNDAVSVSLKSGSVRMLLLLVMASPAVTTFNSIGS